MRYGMINIILFNDLDLENIFKGSELTVSCYCFQVHISFEQALGRLINDED